MRERTLPRPDLVKIDVKGFELEVLKVVSGTIFTCKPKLFIEIHGSNEENIKQNTRNVIGILTVNDYLNTHVELGKTMPRLMPRKR